MTVQERSELIDECCMTINFHLECINRIYKENVTPVLLLLDDGDCSVVYPNTIKLTDMVKAIDTWAKRQEVEDE